ncbi:transcription-repair coupling factor [Salsipaludibacter albus]|uniref:transcription-repair coupling factor n=1 Tax=Salsipaludibacter albus TaxID=2849650 RepID=UPI001EE3E2CF|nr:transcription-repair coupling factor [Salsipaludibacter albus]MBY5161929.1 transcription-repair coupling factor [Salsipaludibacter albus]
MTDVPTPSPAAAARPRSIEDVDDPGLAHGPLASLLRAGRALAADAFLDDVVAPAEPARGYWLSLLAEQATPLLVVTPRTSDAEELVDAMGAYLGEDVVALFPSWETLPHERLSPQPATVGARLHVLDRLVAAADGSARPLAAVVAPIRAVLQPMDPRLASRRPLHLSRHFADGLDGLAEQLVRLGYARTTQVTQRGEFAVRGGIVDVFPTNDDMAIRVEFFGDDIEELRTFGISDQRSVEEIEEVTVDPARELVIDDDLRERAGRLAVTLPSLAGSLEQLADGVAFEGAESLVTLLHHDPHLLPDFLPDGAGVAIADPMLVGDRAAKVIDEAEVLAEVAWDLPEGMTRFGSAGFASMEQMLERVSGRRWDLPAFGATRLPGMALDSFKGDVDAIAARTRDWMAQGLRVAASTAGLGPVRRLSDVLGQAGVPARLHPDGVPPDAVETRVALTPSPLRRGFSSEQLGLVVLGEWDLFGPRRTRRAGRRLGARGKALDTVAGLEAGDAVVHRTHGVGTFQGLVTRSYNGVDGREVTRDYVVVQYAKGDALYIPSDQVDAIARYQGGDTPRPMRLGGAQWEKAKNRVRGAVRDIAGELIRLYAARMHAAGTAFAPDGAMQRELEDAFAHVETVDQVTVIDEIKQDMEAPLPMDRILAGDVGFGKTEVAVRAAAKAIFDGSQVAVLVPTTILAQQHFETFRERFAGFPVNVAMLSRFITDAERREVLDGVAAGTVDLVIGTHALLSKEVEWKRLGLVVVDEEQRFGVTQKERLKQLRTSVDVLSMSATPIPRTLEMAVAGIRDLSVIETPPEERQPITTLVQPWDEGQVTLAVRRELLRDGQVFYLHNQVNTIHTAADHLRELVPDARVAVAHGQMDERALEEVMVKFWEREYDVLVCTTIIESGLDIPNANTLIIERADMLGLGQLHQLRGRVGRSATRGYAYFLYPEGTSITEPAYERLKTIAEHTRLGSGLSIAMRDLEIRGAGNVVGSEQSGHVAAVGFDMYTELLKEEVADLTGETVEEEVEITLDLPVDATLPADYVPDDHQRLDLYKRIAAIRDAAGVKSLTDELRDRYGPLPAAAQRVLTLAALRAAMRRWGVTEVAVARAGGRKPLLRISPVTLADSQQVRLHRRHRHASVSGERVEIPVPSPAPDDLVAWVAGELRSLFAR